jgi:hypothetical protein
MTPSDSDPWQNDTSMVAILQLNVQVRQLGSVFCTFFPAEN